jgi:hypothetical protein
MMKGPIFGEQTTDPGASPENRLIFASFFKRLIDCIPIEPFLYYIVSIRTWSAEYRRFFLSPWILPTILDRQQPTLSQEEYMSAELKEKAVAGLKTTCRGIWTLTVNTARRVKILGRHGLAYRQQRKINRALTRLGTQTFRALEQGEGNPMTAPEVNEAVQKAKDLKEIKEKNYQAMEAIRERIRTSRVKEPPPPPPPPPEAPPAETKEPEKTEEAEKPEETPAQ